VSQEDRAQELELAEYERNQANAIMPIPTQQSALFCQDECCGVEIPEARREAYPGVQFCVECQCLNEKKDRHVAN